MYLLNGTRVLDRANPALKNGYALDASVVEASSSPPRFDQMQEVPHSTIQIRTYPSSAHGIANIDHIYLERAYVPKTQMSSLRSSRPVRNVRAIWLFSCDLTN